MSDDQETIDALCRLEIPRDNGGNVGVSCGTYLRMMPDRARGVLAAIRDGKVPGLTDADALRAQLDAVKADGWEPGGLTRKDYQQEVTLGYELRIKAEAERDEARAKLAEMTKRAEDAEAWRDNYHQIMRKARIETIDPLRAKVAELEAQRDEALARLAQSVTVSDEHVEAVVHAVLESLCRSASSESGVGVAKEPVRRAIAAAIGRGKMPNDSV